MKGYFKSDGTYFEKNGIENDISVNSIYCAQNFDNFLLQKTINKALEHETFEVLSEITLPFKASIYIKNTKTLYLITDIYGYSDIYYKKSEENIYFSDSYRYLIENTDNKLDIKNVALYLKYGFSGDYKTIYQNVKKLPPGCVLKVTEKKSELIKYHEFDNQILENPEPEISSLKTMLNQSINNLNLSKNPIIFYSGGIDSSSILVSLAENGFKPEIFSLKFEEEKYNENNYRDSLLKKLGFKNNEITMTAKNYSDTLKEIINHNQITQLTQDVASFKFLCDKADLKGQSIIFGLPGDECFFGYKYMIEPYIDMDFYFKYRKNILEKINFGGITEILTNEILEKLQNLWNYIPSYLNNNEIKELINYELKTESENTLNLTECKNLFDVKKEIQKFQFNIMLPCNQFNRLNTIEKLTENNILLPFMNREIYKYALSLPFEYCYNQNKEKWILYQAFKKNITEEIFQKSKQGFKIPIKNWLSTPDFDFIKKQLIQQSHDKNSEFSINPDYIKTLYNPLTEQSAYKLWYILGVRSSIFGF